jgi:hypothetical protein
MRAGSVERRQRLVKLIVEVPSSKEETCEG